MVQPSLPRPPPAPRAVPTRAYSWGVRFLIMLAGIWFLCLAPFGPIFLLLYFTTPEDAPPLVVVLLMFVLGGFAGAGLGWAVRLALRQRRVYRFGTVSLAEVTKVVATASTENRRRVMSARYVFVADGRRYEGAWKTVGPPAVGTPIWIVYRDDDPSENLAVPGTYASPARGPGPHEQPHHIQLL